MSEFKIYVFDVLGGGSVRIAKRSKEEAVKWFFETYPHRNFTDCYEQ